MAEISKNAAQVFFFVNQFFLSQQILFFFHLFRLGHVVAGKDLCPIVLNVVLDFASIRKNSLCLTGFVEGHQQRPCFGFRFDKFT